MKMKKLLSLLLALVMMFSVTSVAFSAEPVTPVIVVCGLGDKIYRENSDGTKDQLFPPQTNDIIGALAQLLPTLAAAVLTDDYSILEGNMTKFEGLFTDIACNDDGSLKEGIVSDVYPENVGNYEEIEDVNGRTAWRVAKSISDVIGRENTYFFNYVWTESPLRLADDLNTFIQKVKADTGSSKVSLVACSYGGTITMAYLKEYAENNNYADVKNVVLASTAFQGLDLIGKLYTEDVNISIDSVIEFVGSMIGNDAVETLTQLAVKSLETYAPQVLDGGDAAIKQFVDKIIVVLFKEVFYSTFMNMPGMWCMIPAEYYDSAKATIYPDGNYPAFMSRCDYYIEEIQKGAPDIIEKFRNSGNRNFYITATYISSAIPLHDSSSNYTDKLIDLKYMSGGATVAAYGEFVNENITEGVNCNDSTHNHISGDKIINASTCMLPEQTWFIRNSGHVDYMYGSEAGDLIPYLITSVNEVSIYSNSKFPQFSYLDRDSGTLDELESEDKPLSKATVWDLIVKFFKNLFALIKGVFVK